MPKALDQEHKSALWMSVRPVSFANPQNLHHHQRHDLFCDNASKLFETSDGALDAASHPAFAGAEGAFA